MALWKIKRFETGPSIAEGHTLIQVLLEDLDTGDLKWSENYDYPDNAIPDTVTFLTQLETDGWAPNDFNLPP